MERSSKVVHSNELISNRLNHGLLSTFHRKRRHLFHVDLKIERVVSLPYANGKFFFKIRLLNGGHHVYTSINRVEVNENKVEFNLNDDFLVKMNSRIDNFTLEHCFCRISIRKEGRAGRSYEKIGYYDLDLACYAGCGDEYKACLLNGYQQTNTNPANAYLEIRMKIIIVDGDHIFRRPNDDDDPLSKVDQQQQRSTNVSSSKSIHLDSFNLNDETNRMCSSNNENIHVNNIHLLINTTRVHHSRQASKSSVCSFNSTQSNNNNNNVPWSSTSSSSSHHQDKSSSKIHSTRTNSDEDVNNQQQQQQQQRLIEKRRSPFIDQFGDIQKRLQSTRVDVHRIVNSVINEHEKSNDQFDGCLCLLYNDDGTTRLTTNK